MGASSNKQAKSTEFRPNNNVEKNDDELSQDLSCVPQQSETASVCGYSSTGDKASGISAQKEYKEDEPADCSTNTKSKTKKKRKKKKSVSAKGESTDRASSPHVEETDPNDKSNLPSPSRLTSGKECENNDVPLENNPSSNKKKKKKKMKKKRKKSESMTSSSPELPCKNDYDDDVTEREPQSTDTNLSEAGISSCVADSALTKEADNHKTRIPREVSPQPDITAVENKGDLDGMENERREPGEENPTVKEVGDAVDLDSDKDIRKGSDDKPSLPDDKELVRGDKEDLPVPEEENKSCTPEAMLGILSAETTAPDGDKDTSVAGYMKPMTKELESDTDDSSSAELDPEG